MTLSEKEKHATGVCPLALQYTSKLPVAFCDKVLRQHQPKDLSVVDDTPCTSKQSHRLIKTSHSKGLVIHAK